MEAPPKPVVVLTPKAFEVPALAELPKMPVVPVVVGAPNPVVLAPPPNNPVVLPKVLVVLFDVAPNVPRPVLAVFAFVFPKRPPVVLFAAEAPKIVGAFAEKDDAWSEMLATYKLQT